MVTLKHLLVKFLGSEQKIKYPPIEATILQINPLQVTDDNLYYIDISSKGLVLRFKVCRKKFSNILEEMKTGATE